MEPQTTWKPLPGPQTAALTSKADILFYGGAAGGGKTDLIIGAAHTQHHRSIIFRREYPQLRAIIHRLYDVLEGQGKYNKSDMIWMLEGGRIIELGAVQYPGDEKRYQGRPHDLKAFDELAHFGELQFRTLCGWLRTETPAQRCRVIATGNPPTEESGEWIIRFFAPWLDPTHPKPAEPGELRWFTMLGGKETEVESGETFTHKGEVITPKSRTFIRALVEDNPYYMQSDYKSTLQSLPEPLRSKLLYGDFAADLACDPYQLIPSAWVEEAIKRWEKRDLSLPLSCIGVDVARGGADRTVITLRYGNWFDTQRIYAGSTTLSGDSVTQLVLSARGSSNARVNVDVIGIGSSVFDTLGRYIKGSVHALNSAEASTESDRSGQMHFVNKRAEWWWKLRESLDPAGPDPIALPPDRELLSDLTAPRWRLALRGVLVESKESIHRRIGRSTDKGDSLVYAHATVCTPNAGMLDFYAREVEEQGYF